MLVIGMYLSAVAGLSVICYLFRNRSDDTVDDCDPELDTEATMAPVPVPDIVVSPPDDFKNAPNKIRGRSPITPETQEKILEVLAFVNTPNDQLLSSTNSCTRTASMEGCQEQQQEECLISRKKSTEVITDLKESQARVNAWITELDKVIKGGKSLSADDKPIIKINGSAKVKCPTAICYDSRKIANDERIAKVKGEVAKRRDILAARANVSKKQRESAKNEEKALPRKRCLVADKPGPSSRRETNEKRVQENSSLCARKRQTILTKSTSHPSSHSAASSAAAKSTAEDHKVLKIEAGQTANRLKPSVAGSRGNFVQKQESARSAGEAAERTKVRGVAKPEASKANAQSKAMSSFETRMKYVPVNRSRSPSPVRAPTSSKIPRLCQSPTRAATEAKTSVPARGSYTHARAAAETRNTASTAKATSTTRTTRGTREAKEKTTATPKKSIRITDATLLPVTTKKSKSAGLGERHSSHAGVFTTGDEMATVSTDAQEGCLPELSIIGVRGSQSYNMNQATDFHTEMHIAEEFVAKIARSGPISLNKTTSSSGIHHSTFSMKGAARTPSWTVKKTMPLPQGTDSNVTVYFSVTVPRRAQTEVNSSEDEGSSLNGELSPNAVIGKGGELSDDDVSDGSIVTTVPSSFADLDDEDDQADDVSLEDGPTIEGCIAGNYDDEDKPYSRLSHTSIHRYLGDTQDGDGFDYEPHCDGEYSEEPCAYVDKTSRIL